MSRGLVEAVKGSIAFAHPFVRRFRRPLLVLGLAIFIVGGWFSIAQLELSWSDLSLPNLIILAFIFVPIGLMYGAANLSLTARTAGTYLSPGESFRINAFAQLAEVLPLSGGALVRGAALVAAGTSASRSAGVILANSLLWIACASVGAGLAIMQFDSKAVFIAGASLIVVLIVVAYLWALAGPRLALYSLSIRIIGIFISGWRIFFAFSAISITLTYSQSLVFAFASIAGSASSLAPAGLGIGEGLAAMLATLVATSSAAAFLGVAVNRLVGIAVVAVVCAYFTLMGEEVDKRSTLEK